MPPPGRPGQAGVKAGAQGESGFGVGTRPSGTLALPPPHTLGPDGLSQALSWSFPTAVLGLGQVLRLAKDAPGQGPGWVGAGPDPHSCSAPDISV